MGFDGRGGACPLHAIRRRVARNGDAVQLEMSAIGTPRKNRWGPETSPSWGQADVLGSYGGTGLIIARKYRTGGNSGT